jgi:hypothetical protein
MRAAPIKLFSRLLRLWAVHLVFAVLSIAFHWIAGFIQAKYSVERGTQIALLLSILLTVAYFFVLAKVAMNLVRSTREALQTGLLAALPFVLIIFSAMFYLSKVPHNTIGYSFILLPVTLPFIFWMDLAYPVLPYHALAFIVPLIVVSATVCGSFLRNN